MSKIPNGITLSEFFDKIAAEPLQDYIVTVKCQQDLQDDPQYSNELLLVSCGPEYEWYDDWYRGVKHIEVLGYVAVNDVEIKCSLEHKLLTNNSITMSVQFVNNNSELTEDCVEQIQYESEKLRLATQLRLYQEAFDRMKQELTSNNRGSADYFIVDQIENILKEYNLC